MLACRALCAGPSSWDRVEAGTRTNYGVDDTAQLNRGGSVSALLGEPHHIAGLNSFPVQDLTNTGVEIGGLDTRLSDYAGASRPSRTRCILFRFNQETLSLQRPEVEAAANLDRWNASILYGEDAAQLCSGS